MSVEEDPTPPPDVGALDHRRWIFPSVVALQEYLDAEDELRDAMTQLGIDGPLVFPHREKPPRPTPDDLRSIARMLLHTRPGSGEDTEVVEYPPLRPLL
ncbi:hypothetical protein ACFC14_18595 [Microbacterium sp. NPDC055988]|uniref:hypothetical protein n=1 Tax=Microbacterium sp. NPDC055988 TaxID=3345671 RepID=UPI0035DCD857